jgi:carboxymethylenebutenolidase
MRRALLCLLASCGSSAPPAETPEPSEERRVWGLLTEAEFAALHELSDAEVPPLRGHAIELAGSYAYLSLPEGEPPLAALVVIHEWWGLNDHIRHWTDRLAAAGYAALAVDLYGGRVATTPEEATQLMQAVDEARGREIVHAAVRFLGEDARVRASKRGVIGWCFGGAWSLQTGLAEPELDAIVMYYGRVVTDAAQLRALPGPLLGIFGNQDTAITPASVDEFERALGEAGVEHRILRYDAPHGFANPSGARYDRANAEAAWAEVQAFLARHLRDGGDAKLGNH